MPTIKELEKKRADRLAKHEADRDAQVALDLEAIDALEEAGGSPLHTMTANGYKPGVSVKIAFRSPAPVEYKRYADMVGRSGQHNPLERHKAQVLLAETCLVYPPADSDARKAMFEAFPGLLISLAIEAAKVAEARAEDEGKG